MSISWCVFEGDIDFDSLTAVFEHYRQPRTGPATYHRHSIPTPSEPLSVNTVWGMIAHLHVGRVLLSTRALRITFLEFQASMDGALF